ncbi:MAG: hypothetical protein AAGC76_05080 [Luteibacter sp.]|uniref:hypothetical protein n=1 Tax=Luteibacter sp. TaxID=1886636 RepID=UPI0028066251|nr:hypothetical protein [Luteibacter sp.]MDQ7995210.1 hypothetical protein [Luteibacter sp.]
MIRAQQLGHRLHTEGSTWVLQTPHVTLRLTFEEAVRQVDEHLRVCWFNARAAEHIADILADSSQLHHAAAHAWWSGPTPYDLAADQLLSNLRLKYPREWPDAVMEHLCWPQPFGALADAVRFELAKRARRQLEALLADAPTVVAGRTRL